MDVSERQRGVTVALVQTLLFVAVVPVFLLFEGLEVNFTPSPLAGLVYGGCLYGVAYYLVYRQGWSVVKPRVYQSR